MHILSVFFSLLVSSRIPKSIVEACKGRKVDFAFIRLFKLVPDKRKGVMKPDIWDNMIIHHPKLSAMTSSVQRISVLQWPHASRKKMLSHIS